MLSFLKLVFGPDITVKGFDYTDDTPYYICLLYTSLSAVEMGLVNVMSRETVLKRYLDGIKKNYDYVLLDCRPSLGMLVINALSAADHVLIPVQADYLAAEDMTELVGTVQSIRQQINPKLKIGGVFLTMANDTNFRKDIVAGVKENFGKHLPVLDAVIPATVRLAEISTADKSIFRHEPRGRAAAAYGALVKDCLLYTSHMHPLPQKSMPRGGETCP